MLTAISRLRVISSLPRVLHPTTFSPMRPSVFAYQFSNQFQPRNKEEAFQMQEQQRLKMKPGEEEDEKKTYTGFNKYGVAFLLMMVGAMLYMNHYANSISNENLKFFNQDITGLQEQKNSKSIIGGDWTLVDSEGQPFSSRTLSGYYYIVYFGYTNSPQAVPNALYYMSTMYRVIRNMPEGAYLKLKLVFISIDPERDTPSHLKEYLSNFSKIIIGITGSGPNDIELEQCLKKFKVQKRKTNISETNKDKYDFDFTTNMFLMDSENNFMDRVDPSLTEQQAAKAIVAKIITNEHLREKMSEQAATQTSQNERD